MVLTLNHVLSFISSVTLDKLLNLSGPYLHYLYKEEANELGILKKTVD